MWEDVRRCEKMWEDVRKCEKIWEDVRRCEKMWRWEDVKMRRCEKMWEDVRRWEDVKMRRCEKMWRWEDVKMRGCEDEMWRWEDVKMRGCEDERLWRWEDVKMRGCEDEKMSYRPPLLEEPCAQTLSRKNCLEPNFSKVGSWFFSISKMETFKKMFEIKATWCSLESFLLLSHPRIKSPPILEEKFGSQVSENKRGESFELK